MKAFTILLRVASIAVAVGGSFMMPTTRASAIPVFDPANYAQNLLQAARALEQINNQVQSLQNEASMLQSMAKNLATIDFPQLDRMTSAMHRIDELMNQAGSVDFNVDHLDDRVRTVFPGQLNRVLTTDQRVRQARAQLDAAIGSYRKAMGVQAHIAANVQEDASVLSELAMASQGSVGSLQAAQAANQLMALGVKQQLQLQNLFASEFRDETLERARRIQAEEDGRAATRRFLDGSAAPVH